jgi:hypothetical protein
MRARLSTTFSALFLLVLLDPVPALPQEKTRLPTRLVVDALQTTVFIDRLPWLIARPGRYELHATLRMRESPLADASHGITITSDDVVLDLAGHTLFGNKGSATGILAKLPDKRTKLLLNITVKNGSVRNWSGHGVDLGAALQSRVEDLQIAGNGLSRNSFDGLIVGIGAIVSRCSAQYNAAVGIRAGRGSQLVGCTGSYNGSDGLMLGAGGIARDCVAADNTGDGLVLADGGNAAIDCIASGNGRHGISTGPSARVSGCTTWANQGSGIRVEGYGLVESCLSSDNAGAGILAVSRGARLDGNHLTANGLGLDVSGRGHLVVRNSMSRNGTTWSVPGDNITGGLHEDLSLLEAMQVLATKDPGVSPNSEELELLLRREPWANITH